MAVGSAAWVRVVIVVPTLAVSGQRHQPIVPAFIIGWVISIAPAVRHRIDGPGDVPHVDGPDNHTPHQNAQSELQAAHPLAGGDPTDEKGNHEYQYGVRQVYPKPRQLPLQAVIERVFQEVSRVAIVEVG